MVSCLGQMTHDQEVLDSNPGALLDVKLNLCYCIEFERKVAKWKIPNIFYNYGDFLDQHHNTRRSLLTHQNSGHDPDH